MQNIWRNGCWGYQNKYLDTGENRGLDVVSLGAKSLPSCLEFCSTINTGSYVLQNFLKLF